MAEEQNPDPNRQMKRISRRSFLWAGAAVVGTYEAFHWLHQQGPLVAPGVLPRHNADGTIVAADLDSIGWPFRSALQFDENLNKALYSSDRLSPTYPDSAITEARTNGDDGLGEDFDPSQWTLKLEGLADAAGAILTLDQIKALPRVEFVAELKCIEGWSFFVKWTGARFADLFEKYPPAGNPKYVYMETPDQGYYVSVDLPAAIHPQTLLAYEMNGKPLELEHGAPLRLAIPHKYGVKNIKRIGTIRYSVSPPPDYWADQGYDYYAGL